jgi:glycosyltransferase involved in cell wall biosynthesis
MKLSVVIPTRNRAPILLECLERVFAQKEVDFEVIVADDGSADDTAQRVVDFKLNLDRALPFGGTVPSLIYLRLRQGHQAIARNRGVAAATGDIIVFIGDDIFVEPGFLKQHHDRHSDHPDEKVAVLGFTTWDPALEINPYMRFLEESGWQFGYGSLKPAMIGKAEPYKFFYTSNISLKKSLLLRVPFDESFTDYGWEDIELGYRLWKDHGLQLYYEPEAKGLHHHVIPPSALAERMRVVGRSAVHFLRLHPDARVVPAGLKLRMIQCATQPPVSGFLGLFGGKMRLKADSWRAFMEGVRQELGRAIPGRSVTIK